MLWNALNLGINGYDKESIESDKRFYMVNAFIKRTIKEKWN